MKTDFKDKTSELKAHAYHEAGHVIMGYLCKRPISYVSIESDRLWVRFDNARSEQTMPSEEVLGWSVIAWGGYFGQVKLTHQQAAGLDWTAYNASSVDLDKGLKNTRRVFATVLQADDVEVGMYPEAEDWLHSLWCRMGALTESLMGRPDVIAAHDRLAELLLKKQYIEEPEIIACIGNVVNRESGYVLIHENIRSFLVQLSEHFNTKA